jgi:hypothetical protein
VPAAGVPAASPPWCHPIGRHDSVALDQEC